MQLRSTAYSHGDAIPRRFSCEGDNLSPAFSWSEPPATTQSLALILHDPDAPRANGFTHWVVYNLPASLRALEEGAGRREKAITGGLHGRNDSGELGYLGPCPPSGTHRYFARIYALNAFLDLPPGANRQDVTTAMQGHLIESAELMGTYTRAKQKLA